MRTNWKKKYLDAEDEKNKLKSENDTLERAIFEAKQFIEIAEERIEKAYKKIDGYLLIIKNLKEKHDKDERK